MSRQPPPRYSDAVHAETGAQLPLAGITVLELAGLAPVPFCGLVLADFGANVVRIDRAGGGGIAIDQLTRGKRSLALDLKRSEGVALLLRLAEKADVLLDPFRPGVLERMYAVWRGLGPADLQRVNPRLVIGRISGYGQTGPMRHAAGHDLNYLATSGVLSLLGRHPEPPFPSVNLLGDFAGGSLLCAFGIVAALFQRTKTGRGQVVDSSMTEGAAYLASFLFYGREGMWAGERGTNTLDGGAPHYQTYATKDGGFMAVGALEPQFFRLFVAGLPIGSDEKQTLIDNQLDQSLWPATRQRFAEIFRTKTRAEWEQIYADKPDACVTPVLSLAELRTHPHHTQPQRPSLLADGGPRPSPLLSSSSASSSSSPPTSHTPLEAGMHSRSVLAEFGLSHKEIEKLCASGVVYVHTQARL